MFSARVQPVQPQGHCGHVQQQQLHQAQRLQPHQGTQAAERGRGVRPGRRRLPHQGHKLILGAQDPPEDA